MQPVEFRLALLCLLLTLPGRAWSASAPPNIVVIHADDVGLGDLSHYWRAFTDRAPPVETPHLDRLAGAGMWFTDAHSPTALCSPTRYSVLSGNYTFRSYAPWGVWGSFRRSPFQPGQATLGSVPKRAGYATGFIGKWHLGGDFRTKDGSRVYRKHPGDGPHPGVDLTRMVGGGPRDAGFDYDFTTPCGVQGPLYLLYENGGWSPFHRDSGIVLLNEENVIDPRFLSSKGSGMGDSRWDARELGDRLSSKAVAFIQQHAGDTPLLLYYCTPAVHLPWTPPAEFDGQPVAGSTPTPHMDMIRELDLQVGRIVAALEERGVYENTLIVFTSDNGGLPTDPAPHGHNPSGGYRGFKNQAYEGGHRVPLIAVWPGRIEPGTRSGALIASHDLVATVAAVTGVELAADEAVDSRDFLPVLLGEPGARGRDELLLQGGTALQVVYRRGPWKLIVQTNRQLDDWTPVALFNLDANPYEEESRNLVASAEQQSRVAEMLTRYLEIRQEGETRQNGNRSASERGSAASNQVPEQTLERK